MAQTDVLLAEIRAMRGEFSAKIDRSQKEIQGTMQFLTNELSTKIEKMETDMNEFKSRLERFEQTVAEIQKKEPLQCVTPVRMRPRKSTKGPTPICLTMTAERKRSRTSKA